MGCGRSKTLEDQKPNSNEAKPQKTETKEVKNENVKHEIHKEVQHTAKDHPEKCVKPVIIFVLGGPGSGKGTQCTNLVSHGFTHLSTGDLIRAEIENNGPQAETLRDLSSKGILCPSDIIVKLVKSRLDFNSNKKYLIDGFPRSEENVNVWESIIGDTVQIGTLLYFECSSEVMKQRLLKRAETSGRKDDVEDVILDRIKTYETQTFPIIERYQKINMVIKVDCDKGVDEVYEATKNELNKKGLI